MRELDLWLKVFNVCNVGKVRIASKFGWKESFDPVFRTACTWKYFASMAASRKRYWSSNAGTLTAEMTTSAPEIT